MQANVSESALWAMMQFLEQQVFIALPGPQN
jgi:hypothetical protein